MERGCQQIALTGGDDAAVLNIFSGHQNALLAVAIAPLILLAIVNLFPFLPLDGGHIFWALAEKVRGRVIPFSVMERASVVGFALGFPKKGQTTPGRRAKR